MRCEPKLARSRVVVLPSATIASTRSLGGSNSDFPPPVQSQGASSSSPGKALVLAVSESSARPDQCFWQQCMPLSAPSIAARATRCFFASSPVVSAPPFNQHHLAQAGMKTQSPCSTAQRACSKSQDSGLPKAAPAPPCLLEPPSIEAQHFSIRQSSIYVGL